MKKAPISTKEVAKVEYDSEMLGKVAFEVKSQGFVPESILREKFGHEATTKAIAVLLRDARMIVKTRQPYGEQGEEATGYSWGDKRFSKSEARSLESAGRGILLTLQSPMVVKYGEFEQVTTRCRYTTPILGSVPVKDKDGDPTNVFERDATGNALLLPYHQRAMASVALPMIGKEAAAARRIGFQTIRIPIDNGHPGATLRIVEHGITEINRSGGKGLRRSEELVDPIEFSIRAMVPTTVLALDEYLRMLTLAGQFVRLSPGRSAGFGEFEVLGAE